MNQLMIYGIECEVKIGVYDWEKIYPQVVLIDIDCSLPNNINFKNDNLDDTINYELLVNSIRERYKYLSFNLLEALALDIVDFLIEAFNLSWIKVKVEKQGILSKVKNIAIIIEKNN